ncbi:MAG: sugar ABC transporter substrate-binding protein [Eubacteriales bacterium]|nr:sugar ABC transporter substrate-binding protein [Eubacteriales bacterium]
MKKYLALILVFAMAISLMACGSTPAPTTAKPTTQSGSTTQPGTTTKAEYDLTGKKIVVVLKNLVNPFWVDVQTGCLSLDGKYGVEVEVVAPVASDNNDEQIQLIEQKLIEGCDALVIAPSDSKGITPAIEAANQAGVPVINLNTGITGEGLKLETFVATENYDVAVKTAEALAKAMNYTGKIVILEGVPGQQNSIDRTNGALDTFAKYPNMEVIDDQIANWSRSEAMKMMQDLLQKHAQIDGVFAVNGEMALGTAEAVAQAGKTGEIFISGIDITKELTEAVRDGKITLTNDGVSDVQGSTAVQAAIDVLNGLTVEKRIVIDTVNVTLENIDEYIKKYGL